MALHTVATTGELAVGEMKACKIADEKIVLYHLDDGFYATQGSCTHVFANLSKGKIVDDCKIQCPFHRARFDIRTGAVVDWANFPPGVQLLNVVRGEKPLKTFKVVVEGEQVKVEV